MKLLNSSPRLQSSPKADRQREELDPKTAGYIRLLGAILNQPAESIARQLCASEAVVQALAVETEQTAA